ncbi:MAG: riboflavin synthase [Elusimicrobia bacterium]|nr:riboflavin synthase [Elusimicrobiota bacterium]
MFTGIIEELGTLKTLTSSHLIVVSSFGDILIGDSVAVNGICLTAVTVTPCGEGVSLGFDYSPETFRHTALELAKAGDRVNLERALKVGGRIGGHFLSGHVECLSTIAGIKKDKDSYLLSIKMHPSIERYIVSKGSVGIDGISLTVAEVSKSAFTVAVIPHTFEHTTLKYRTAGNAVNIEPDILAKYTEKLIEKNKSKLSLEFLKENGF